jgi:hypothetical protein
MRRGHAVMAYGLGISDFGKSGYFRLSELWKGKQKHIDAYDIIQAFNSYPNIPSTFDGSLPWGRPEDGGRIETGQTYFFEGLGENGLVGRVTAASVSEEERKMYLVVKEAEEEATSRQEI